MASPAFFIVGAPRCGTTTLHAWLRTRPGIFLPVRKELHYFSADRVRGSYYRPVTIESEAEYLVHYAACPDGLLAGDCSPSYLAYPAAAARIRAFCNDARILVILRDPVERALSHYHMDVDKGLRTLPLRSYLMPVDGFDREYEEYVGNSLYADAVARYVDAFPRERVLVVVAEELWANPEPIARRILDFLGATPAEPVWNGHAENRAAVPRFAATRLLQRTGLMRRTVQVLPKRTKRALRQLLLKPPTRRRYEVTQDDRVTLARLLAPDVERLSDLHGRDLAPLWTSTCRCEVRREA